MTSPRHIVTAVVAAAGYLVVGVISIISPQPDDHWDAAGLALEAAFVVALLGSLFALDAVRAQVAERALGVRAARLAQVGFAAMTVSAIASLVRDGDTLGPVFLLGVLATLTGLLLLGIAGLREALAPRWVPVVPFATMLIGMALASNGGCAVIAAGWVALAVALNAPPAHVRRAVATA